MINYGKSWAKIGNLWLYFNAKCFGWKLFGISWNSTWFIGLSLAHDEEDDSDEGNGIIG